MSIELVVGFPQTHIVAEPPTAPPDKSPETGQVRIQIGPDSRVNLWQWTGVEWKGHGLAPIIGSGNPQSVVASDFMNQIYMNTSDNNTLHFSVSPSIGSTNWQQLGVSMGS
jgi:hypothetical protein